jgi:hypothetical protein
MAEAIKYDNPDINAGKWLRDIARAIKLLSDTLCQIHKCSDKWCDIRTRTLSGSEYEIIQRDISKKTVMRGTVYAAEFDGEPTPDDRK